MGGRPISQLNEGIRYFKECLEADPLAALRTEVAVVTYSSKTQVIHDFSTVDQFNPPTLEIADGTIMSTAMEKALEMVEGRKETYKKNAITYYRPWIWLICDGRPEHDPPGAFEESLRQNEAGREKGAGRHLRGGGRGRRHARPQQHHRPHPGPDAQGPGLQDNVRVACQIHVLHIPVPTRRSCPTQQSHGLGTSARMNTQPNWMVCEASVAGTKHLRTGTSCQDNSRTVVGDGWIVTALSDGAGSAARAKKGSDIAATMSAHNIASQLAECQGNPTRSELPGIIQAGATAALGVLKDAAKQSRLAPQKYACTLLIAVQTENLVAAGQIGDGGIVFSADGKNFRKLTTPHRGQYVNQTLFLTSRGARKKLHLTVQQEQSACLALFSDGLENLVMEGVAGEPHQPFFNTIFNWLHRQETGKENRCRTGHDAKLAQGYATQRRRHNPGADLPQRIG